MRSFLFTVALLGLWNIFLSTNAAPIGLSDSRFQLDTPRSSRSLFERIVLALPKTSESALAASKDGKPTYTSKTTAAKKPRTLTPANEGLKSPVAAPTQTYPVKPVPRAFDSPNYDYILKKEQENQPAGTEYLVKTKHFWGGDQPLDIFYLKTVTNEMTWSIVRNNREDITNTSPRKLRLSDIAMAAWVNVGKTPQDLQVIHVEHIKNPVINNAMKEAQKRMGKTDSDSITVKSTGTGQELNSFNLLLGTPFGLSALKMSQSFQMGKTVKQFHIKGDSMDITFG
ncbi:hypothetical protein NHQ30_002988 [Ciborinia camelliae]|nr:hypothetical protein NHQ30_002988 [Ciborinia camelliae]